jgi:hypothetical protein
LNKRTKPTRRAEAGSEKENEKMSLMRVKGTGLYVSQDEDVYTLPCLAGENPNRIPGTLLVTIEGGKLVSARTGEALSIATAHMLMGWDKLDGPAVFVGGVSVPMPVIDHLREHCGLNA